MKRAGRKEPYTDRGIERMKCVRCGAKAMFQWNACADDNLWRPICLDCDIELNRMVLEWMGDADAAVKVARYEALKRGNAAPAAKL